MPPSLRPATSTSATCRGASSASPRTGPAARACAWPCRRANSISVEVPQDVLPRIVNAARAKQINLRTLSKTRLGVAFDETVTDLNVTPVIAAFATGTDGGGRRSGGATLRSDKSFLPESLARTTPFCTHPVFNTHHSETDML